MVEGKESNKGQSDETNKILLIFVFRYKADLWYLNMWTENIRPSITCCPGNIFFQLLLTKMLCWESFNATTNITKYNRHVNNTVARTAFNIYFLWSLPLPTLIGMPTTQNVFPNLVLGGRLKKSVFKHILNTALTSFIEAKKDLMNLKTSTKWEKRFFEPSLALPYEERMYLVLKKGDYNMESAYSGFGVCFVLFMACFCGLFVCLFVFKGKGLSAFMQKAFSRGGGEEIT